MNTLVIGDAELGATRPPEPGTYTPPEHGWTCFHCGETFHGVPQARDHFGLEVNSTPGCIEKLTAEDRSLLRKLRGFEARYAEVLCDLNNEISASRVHHESLAKELQRLTVFKDCSTLQDVFNLMDTLTGEVLVAMVVRRMFVKYLDDPRNADRFSAEERDLFKTLQEEAASPL